MNKILISVFYVGFIRFAPGTFGSLVGVLIGLLVQKFSGFPGLLLLITSLFVAGWISSKIYLANNIGKKDPQEVVIDEVVGQLVSYTPISFYIWLNSESTDSQLHLWPLAFVLFRMFDIWKPWPISWADKLDSALGIMLDDLLAGLYSAILISLWLVIF